jgi:hypothetical protein
MEPRTRAADYWVITVAGAKGRRKRAIGVYYKRIKYN